MIDLLFIHAPKFNDMVEGMDDAMFVNLIPSGVFAMADFLEEKGVKTRILHLGIEWILRGRFDPIPFMKTHTPSAAALSLHWHHQSYDVIETAKRIRAEFPEMPIILGGLTAGYFACEILEKYSCIDFVIEGDGEVPLLELMKVIKKGIHLENLGEYSEALNNIPNLYYKLNNFKESIADDTFSDKTFQKDQTANVVKSPDKYISTPEILDSLNYANFKLLNDFVFYRDEMGIPALWLKNGDVEYNRRHLQRMTKVFFPAAGRGCPARCPWCGKERRLPPLFRSLERVYNSIRTAEQAGFENLYFTYDPCRQASLYYISLFKLLRESSVNMSAYFECWRLPEPEFIREFKRTFSDGVIALSPESGSEEVRKRNRGIFHSSAALEETLELTEKEGLETDLFFSLGIPGENEEIFEETRRMIRHFRERFSHLGEICLFGIELEPGSPWFEEPEKFGIVSGRKCFEDYHNAHKPGNRGSFSSLGYYIPDYFRDRSKCSNVEEFENALEKLRNENMKLKDIFRGKD